MDKFVIRKTAPEAKIDVLAAHLKAVVPQPAARQARGGYRGKPWASWDDKQREAASLFFLQKGLKACVVRYGGSSCPPPGQPFGVGLIP